MIRIFNKLKASRFPLLPMLHPPTLWQSIINADPYRIRGLWILGSNPLLNQTDPKSVEKALDLVEFVVVSDFFFTPTAQRADLVLPFSMWLDQDDVVNTMKQWCILPRQKVVQVGEARDDREAMLDLIQSLGFNKAFPWKNHRQFVDWMLEDSGLSFEQFCEKGILTAKMRYRKHEISGFKTQSGKLELYSELLEEMGVSPLPVYREPDISPIARPDLAKQYPYSLTTRRIRSFYHS